MDIARGRPQLRRDRPELVGGVEQRRKRLGEFCAVDARAFFYAGARALLVSHWSVASDAATRLTTSTFDIIGNSPKTGRAEALRQAMLAYMNDNSGPLNAYPGFWGPFSIVGEGAAP